MVIAATPFECVHSAISPNRSSKTGASSSQRSSDPTDHREATARSTRATRWTEPSNTTQFFRQDPWTSAKQELTYGGVSYFANSTNTREMAMALALLMPEQSVSSSSAASKAQFGYSTVGQWFANHPSELQMLDVVASFSSNPTVSFVNNFGSGFVSQAISDLQGGGNAILHPLDTIKGLFNGMTALIAYNPTALLSVSPVAIMANLLEPVASANVSKLYTAYQQGDSSARAQMWGAWAEEGASLFLGGVSAFRAADVLGEAGLFGRMVKITANADKAILSLDPFQLQVTHEMTMSKNAFARLMNDIKVNGIQNTIKYIEHEGENYIVDGNHRVVAARQLGINQIPVEKVELPYAGYKSIEDLYYYGSNF